MLKPWLDKDLYFKIKEQVDNVRINSSATTVEGADTRFDKEVTYLDDEDGDDIFVEYL